VTDRYGELRDVAGPVSRETFDRLLGFDQLFERWSARINLTSNSTASDRWRRHLLDSAQLLKLAPEARRWADFGSGGGFPGAVIALAMPDRNGRIDLVESNRKKAAFLKLALAGLDATVHDARIEDLGAAIGRPEVVTARALAPLPRLLALLAPWLTQGARGLFHKGRGYQTEIAESADAWDFDLVEHRSAVDPEGVVLDISNLRPVK
jgi:16S rRNA (guanine527-N7)-methyltransferase